MRLIGSLTSPYVRLIRALCECYDFSYTLEQTSGFGQQTPAQIENIEGNNPLLRVPILIDNDVRLIESRVIANYLIKKKGAPPLTLEQENTLSVIYGALEAALLRFMMKRSDPDLDLNRGYFLRLQQRLESAMRWLDDHFKPSPNLAPTDIALVCALDWLERRHMHDWRGYKHLPTWHANISQHPCLLNTRIPDNI